MFLKKEKEKYYVMNERKSRIPVCPGNPSLSSSYPSFQQTLPGLKHSVSGQVNFSCGPYNV